MKKKVVFILGIGRSGSTLLNYILGSHPDCFDLNEISKLPQFYRHRHRHRDFWEETGKFWEEKFTPEELKMLVAGLSNRRITPYIPLKVERFLREISGTDRIFNSYSLIFSKLDATVLIDSSKYVDWVSKKLQSKEFRSGQIDGYLIHLIRDGRAVLNSYLRWDKNMTVEKFSHRWSRLMKEDENLFNQFPSERKMMVRYEELASEPKATTEKICQMLDLEFQPEMLEYWKHEHFGIEGNFGTRSLIAKYKSQKSDSKVEEVHGDYYQKQGFQIKLDLRWKNELDPEKIEEFYRLTQGENKQYEWD
ncbi:sulfotransferase family protein [Phormidium sp. CCY1219]|uniref:sulfotransferase family protein n=1 Tax=Phormidium sp. CCY1219 TaxID=2886104 RepID=UPI002D1F9878|nr:sulfotransferase [Phormidium sp. CCY1219]MEB3831781.1 sulfotransferase [Phormidium sp. CCY1219]